MVSFRGCVEFDLFFHVWNKTNIDRMKLLCCKVDLPLMNLHVCDDNFTSM